MIKKLISTFALACTIAIPSVSLASATPKLQSYFSDAETSKLKNDSFYQKARKEFSILGDVGEDYYVVYRLVERIARANGLDSTSWRIRIMPEYDINAFATEANLLAFYSGLLDQLDGDASALACVVGHEMAHHTERHIAIGQAEKQRLIAQFQLEAEQEVNNEQQAARDEATTSAVGGALLGNLTGGFGGIGGFIGNIGGNVLTNSAQNRLEVSRQRVTEIVERKKQELEQRIAESSRNHEFEADELGYKYIAKAGFETEGCLRVMEVLGRMPGAELDSSHPAIPKRVEQLRAMSRQYPASKLAQEGKPKLSTPPLTYSVSRDNASIRVNSRKGGSSADNLDRMFK